MTTVNVKVNYVPLHQLSKHPHNPRTISDADLHALCESIREDPLYFETRPIICSARSGSLVIIAGEKRFIADGFGGSGTTMVASHQLDRRCYMSEYDPKYCQVIIDRMVKLDHALSIMKNGKAYNSETTVN